MRTLYILLITLLLFSTAISAQQEIRKTIYFDYNSSTINNEEANKLDSLITAINLLSDFKILLNGHTDDVGNNDYNDSLSIARCSAVQKYLVSHKVNPSKIGTANFGESRPKVNNTSLENRAKNRRVEIVVNVIQPALAVGFDKAPDPSFGSGVSNPSGGTGSGSNNTVILKPGPNSVGGYGIEVITNTNQMQGMNLTTMTTDGEPMVSNVMACITSAPVDTTRREPFVVLVPASNNPFCKGPDVQFYDSQSDSSADKTIKWMPLVYPDLKPVVVDGVEYYEWTFTPRPGRLPCKNADCPKDGPNGVIKLSSRKHLITSVEVIYPRENALLKGKEKKKNLWTFRYFSNDSIKSPQIKVTAKDGNGNEYIANVILRDLKKNRRGEFVLKKKMFIRKDT